MSREAYVAGTGSFLPGDPIPYEEMEKYLGVLDQAPVKVRKWIAQATPLMREVLDINVVHYAIDPVTGEFNEDNVTMAVKAAKIALADGGFAADEIDLICYGSAHQDQMPTASVRIQEELGIETCAELSIHANCSSAYKALYLAAELIKTGRYDNALVLSANVSSSELRADYYNQPLLDKAAVYPRFFLCDGAGAVLLTSDRARSKGFLMELGFIESIGGKRKSIMQNGRPAYWMNPREEFEKGLHHLKQDFQNSLSTNVFQEEEGSIFFKGLMRMLTLGGIPVETLKFFQINLPAKHIVDSVKGELAAIGIPESKVYSKLDRLGYCGPPMVFVCLDKMLKEETFSPGERVVSFVTEVSKFMQAGYSLKYVG